MSVVFLGKCDYANISHRTARGIRQLGGQARVVTTQRHPFGYEEDIFARWGVLTSAQKDELRSIIEDGCACTIGDGYYEEFRRLLGSLGTPKIIASRQAGSLYRARSGYLDAVDKKLGVQVRFVGCDLFRLSLKGLLRDVTYPYIASYDSIVPNDPTPAGDRVRVAHSPSNRGKKGTELIIKVLADFDVDVDLIEGVSHAECLKRRSEAHIFIDQIHPDIGGFGASSVEAMAQGCAVLCDIHNVVDEVFEYIKKPPILPVNNEHELRQTLRWLIEDRDALELVRGRSVVWAVSHASPEAVARYWLKHINGGS